MRSYKIPEYLKSVLKRRRITQARLSIETGLTENCIHRILNGKAIIRVDDLEEICRYLDIMIPIGDDSKPVIRKRG